MKVLLVVLAAAQEPSREALDFFEKKVRPLLAERCYSCHAAEAKKIRGGLRVDGREELLRGGDSGPSVVPGHPERSLLLRAVRYDDPDLQMPPKEKLPAKLVDDLARWIQMGAPWPAGEARKGPAPAREGLEITAEDRAWWAFRPVIRPAVPAAGASHPVDAFLLARLKEKGLRPAPPASRDVLIRRATYDLTGLPPTAEEVDAFVGDPAPDAWEKLIDRLLGRPGYGEKWGRHWLDLVRFAETNGYERDGDKPDAWRYRDYVIRAFNEDKPYDVFLKEQLAGDEMEPASPDAVIAAGYHRLGLVDDEPADRELALFDGLDDIVSTTSQVMLGMTIGCARCHDHKKDPILQADYYRFLAFFRGIDATARDGPKAQAVLVRDEEGHRDFERKLRPLEERLKALKGKDDEPRRKALQKEIDQIKKHPPKDQKALSVSESGRPPDTHVLRRGNPRAVGEKVEPGYPAVLGVPDPDLSKAARGRSSGRRSVLAGWIASPSNPLTSRVMANRLWQHHFGRAIAPTPSDFGRLGEPPTHPELLDWLASEFVARGWRMKAMHRLLMTSAAYRASSRDDAEALAKDPANELLWRFPPRRLSAEELRDSVLAVNGTLNRKAGGPSVFPPLPKEVLATSSMPKSVWGTSSPEEAARRSVYIKVKRSLTVPLLAAHDVADTDSSCAVRFATTVPTQALTLLNGEFMNRQAELFARRLERERPGDVDAQVRLALRSVTQRAPTDAEAARGRALIDALREKDGWEPERALAGFCLMALNLNEFVYLD